MVTFKRFTAYGIKTEYCDTIKEAVEIANKFKSMEPDEIWKYNPDTKKYDKKAGSFKVAKVG